MREPYTTHGAASGVDLCVQDRHRVALTLCAAALHVRLVRTRVHEADTLAAVVVLAKCNGTLLVDDDGKLGVVERGGSWVNTAMFVAALLTVVPGAMGVSMLTSGQLSPLPFLAASFVPTIAFVLLLRRKRRDNASSAAPAPWLVFDVPANVVRDSAGAVLCPLDQVSLAKVGQMASSSRALVAYCPKETVIARGNPFGNSVAEIEDALRSRGIGSRPDLALRAALKQ